MPFTLALSFMTGILTTIAAYSLRDEPRAAVREEIETPAPAMAEIAPVGDHVELEPDPKASIGPVTEAAIVVQLRDRDLKVPVDGVERDDLVDTFTDARGSRSHEALDIIAPRNTRVRAVDDGRIQKLFTSIAGGLTIYQFDPTGTFAYYYAHSSGYADGLREGNEYGGGRRHWLCREHGQRLHPTPRTGTSPSSGSGPSGTGAAARPQPLLHL